MSIRPHPGRASLDTHIGNTSIMRSFYDLAEFDQKPELAHARAQDFYDGVYKRFLVRGPAKLTVQVNRNHAFNTILPGVMLDLVDELPPPYYQTRQEWEAKPAGDAGEKSSPAFVPAGNAAEAAQQLAAALATSCYQLNLFADWEQQLQQRAWSRRGKSKRPSAGTA